MTEIEELNTHSRRTSQSDITYIRLVNQWGYLSLVTDAYSRKIMGYCFRTDMSVAGCLHALQMALDNRRYPNERLIHHSDRGSQYCSAAYTQLLTEQHIAISMTENGDPYENALAERMNGIIKSEFNLYESRAGFEATGELITRSINAYNHLRPHSSCDFLTPEQAHQQKGALTKRWKNYYHRHLQKPLTDEITHSEEDSKTAAARLSLKEQATAAVLRTAEQTLIFEKTMVK